MHAARGTPVAQLGFTGLVEPSGFAGFAGFAGRAGFAGFAGRAGFVELALGGSVTVTTLGSGRPHATSKNSSLTSTRTSSHHYTRTSRRGSSRTEKRGANGLERADSSRAADRRTPLTCSRSHVFTITVINTNDHQPGCHATRIRHIT